MKTSKCWEKRAESRESQAHISSAELEKEIVASYQKAQRAIQRDIEAFYARYRKEENVSYSEAVKYFIENTLVSTSKTIYDERKAVQFIIQSKNGADISAYNKKELEVLFTAKTRFYVRKILKNTIYLEEA